MGNARLLTANPQNRRERDEDEDDKTRDNQVGAGLTISPYDGSIKDYTGESAALSLGGKIAYLPIKSEKINENGEMLG